MLKAVNANRIVNGEQLKYAAKNKKDMKDEVWCEIWADDAIEIEDQKIVEKIIKIRKYLWW